MRCFLPLVIALAACGDDGSSTMPDASPVPDDAGSDASGSTCTGACMTTSLSAMLLETRVLDRANFGLNADNTLHVEAHLGGDTGCPTMSSPAPDYTLVLGRVAMSPATSSPSATANFLDFVGDMLTNMALGQAATAVTVTPVAYEPGTFVALDVMLTFPDGTLTGHLYATHCDSLDEV